ncbi:capsular biosynthesis protein [Aeromicrobium sp. A1-2]|uniref:polysaccharide biosynthesis tyrosine autokinase n=1 Tax=Aeromicrobium sp. A1-2 TaxID=2107713 RepID=UPI000E4D6213|nr:polysaccharide biosynthesis tyrosine autokinase [Aeromicrobium sp. A1-2]AXT86215.1 capsular biosynthesis protein [Aeromicrobium sp. A1-2]
MELRQLLRTLRRRWKFAVASFLLGIIGAAVLTSAITPTYQSQARIYVTATSTGTLDAYNLSIYSAQRVASYADLAKDPAVLQRVIKQVGLDITPDELGPRVSATAVPNTVILQITVTDEDPQVARDLARAEGNEIVKLVATLEAPGKTADGEEQASPIIARLAGDASYDANPVSPNLTINLAVGAILGLLIGVAGAVLRDMFDTSIKTPQDLSEVTDSAVMAIVPFDSSVPKHPLISDDEGSRERVEAFRVLRTNLQFVELDSKRQMLMISSAVPDEGKTVTATNLAITLAQTGRRVLILDADFRKPRVARLLGLENSVGVLTVLVGRAPVEECIQQHESGVDFLATGPTPPNPAEVLETQAMRDLLMKVRDAYDVVIIDAPPLLPVADPAIIAPMADGVLLVTRYAKTDKDLVQEAVDRLDAVDGRIVGVVLNMTPRRAVSGYGYGYGYGYGEEIEAGRSMRAATKPRRASRGERKQSQHERTR